MKKRPVEETNCPPDQQLDLLLSGELKPQLEAEIDTHVNACENCQTRLETLTDSDQALHWKQLLNESETDTIGLRSWRVALQSQPDWDDQLAQAMRQQGFELLDLIGRGGMGQVYRARQESPARVVAIKMMRDTNADSSHLKRFFREANSIAHISHPNVVKIFQVGECSGRPYLVLEYIEGPSLAQFTRGRTLGPKLAAEWMLKIAYGVEDAHRMGILHRDLKPANLLLAPVNQDDGWDPQRASQPSPGQAKKVSEQMSDRYIPKIADFGLARPIQTDENAGQPTHSRQLLGTPFYMSPELIAGQNHAVDHRADVYALGVILYELLTGRVPFRGSSQYQLLKNIETQEAEGFRAYDRNLPTDLEAICLKCLEKVPARRYGSAECFAADLQRYLTGQPVEARRASVFVRWQKRVMRRPKATMLIASLATTILIAMWLGQAWLQQRKRSLTQYRSAFARAQEMVDEAESSQLIEVAAWNAAVKISQQAMELESPTSNESEPTASQLFEYSRERLRDHQFARELDQLWIQAIVAKNLRPDQSLTDQYRDCFHHYGLNLTEQIEVFKKKLKNKPPQFRSRLLTAVHHFHVPLPEGIEKETCRQLLWELEDNPWRKALFENVDGTQLSEAQIQNLSALIDQPNQSVDPEILAFTADYLTVARVPTPRIVKFLRECQQAHPNSFWLNYFLARYIRLVDHPQMAIPFARAALAKRDRPATRVFLAGIYHDSLQFQAEEKELLAALEQDPDFEPARFELAQCYQRQKKFEKAIQAYLESLKQAPWRDRLKGQLLQCYVQAGKLKRAQDFANQLVTTEDDQHPASHARAQAYRYLGHASAAIQEYERAIDQEPSCLHCYVEVARIYEQQNELAKAEQHLRSFLSKMPTGIEAGRLLVDVLLKQNKTESALALAQNRATHLNRIPSVWRDLGRVQIHLGQDDSAVQSLRQVLSIQADDVNALVELGRIHHRQKKFSLAESELKLAIRSRPESELANGALIDFLFKLRRNDEAVSIAQGLAQRRPQSVYAQWKLMEALRMAGQYAKAIETFEVGRRLERPAARFFTSTKLAQLEGCRQVTAEYDQLGDISVDSLSAEQANSFCNVVLAPRGEFRQAAKMIMHAIEDRTTMSADGMYFSAVFESALLSLLASQMREVTENDQQLLRKQAIEQLEKFVDEFANFVEQRPEFARQNRATWRLIPDNEGISALRLESRILNLPKSQAERCRKLWSRFESIVNDLDQ